MNRLRGKLAIVTGGSRGIGAAIARSFASEGAKVVITSRKQHGLDAVAAEINAEFPDSVVPIACHVGKIDQVKAFIDQVTIQHGLASILVNNAATNVHFGPLLTAGWSAWDKTFEVNLKGPFEMSRQVAERLLAADKPGSIINVSSVLGMAGAPLQGVYGMTKAAMISMTKTFSIELGHANIRVNAIAPGLVNTKLASAIVSSDDLSKLFTERSPLKRHAEPHEMTGICVYLASDEASYVTGQTFPIDGGYTAV